MYKNYFKVKFLLFFLSFFSAFCVASSPEKMIQSPPEKTLIATKELWTQLKYHKQSDKKKIADIKSLLKEIKTPSNRQELAWLFMIEATLAGLEGGFEALSRLSHLVEKNQKYFTEPSSVEDFMICSLLGYLHLKVPTWPVGFGSKKVAKKWLKKAHGMEYEPDVAFYLAQSYDRLGHTKQAQLFAQVSFNGYLGKKTPYEMGKVKELENLDFFKPQSQSWSYE